MNSPLINIEIVWSESCHFEDGETFTTIDALETRILQARQDAPKNGTYDKTKFLIRFENPGVELSEGEESFNYEGRIDLQHPEYNPTQTLEQHLADFREYAQRSPYFDDKDRKFLKIAGALFAAAKSAEALQELVA